ncbi:MAG: hypothetical protein AAGG68_11680 [Bacteroidota bacterium]
MKRSLFIKKNCYFLDRSYKNNPFGKHIPHLKTISDFYQQFRIGQLQDNDFSVMRIEEHPNTKRLKRTLFRCNFYRVVFFLNEGVE